MSEKDTTVGRSCNGVWHNPRMRGHDQPYTGPLVDFRTGRPVEPEVQAEPATPAAEAAQVIGDTIGGAGVVVELVIDPADVQAPAAVSPIVPEAA